MVVGKEETVMGGMEGGSDSEESLVIKTENDDDGSSSRIHQEFINNVVEINSNRA